MERDFELEYRELKQNETPDLWNRIEAGLPEKKVSALPWKRLGLLAAACLCVVILVPALMIGLTDFYKNSSSGADTALDVEYTESITSTDSGAGAEYTESAAADAGSMAGGSDTAAMESAEAKDSAEAASEAAAAGAEISEDVMPELTDGQILEGVTLQIVQADETEEETVYQAVVLETDVDAAIEEGIQIEVICNDETQYDFIREPREESGLKTEEIYEVSLQYGQDRFVVLKAAKKN